MDNFTQTSGMFWSAVDNFRDRLLNEERMLLLRQVCDKEEGNQTGILTDSPELSRPEVLQRIEASILQLLTSLSKKEAPSLSYNSRNTWGSVRFQEGLGLEMTPDGPITEVKFDSLQSVNKFGLTLKVLSHMYKLIQTDTFSTKRDVYYHDPSVFGSQATVDTIVDDLSCMLKVPRWHLHVLATSKGCLAGDLQYTEGDGNIVDCRGTCTGILVPTHVTAVYDIRSEAKFILVVEKDATFQRLLDDGICDKFQPCIILTGKGFPDVNSRLMLRRLWDELKVPVFGLVDADPHGIEILSVYKFGSRALSFESGKLAVPAMRWIGVWPSDIDRLQIPRSTLLPVTKSDTEKTQELLARPYITAQPAWKYELELLQTSSMKAEIQCLQSVSANFLIDVYLPNKLRCGGWV